jgi:dTDP-L-rhamnose 4-epimerase
MEKILITGGAGFIGSHLARRLLDKGYEVRILDNLSPQIHGDNPETTSPLYNSIKDLTDFIHGSVLSEADLKKSIKNQNVIVHLAAETGTGQSMYQIQRYSRTNILGTSLLLDVLLNNPHRVRKVIVASSRAIYGEGKYFSRELGVVYPENRQKADLEKGDFEVKYPGSGPLSVMATDETSKIHPSSIYGISKQVQEQLVLTVCKSMDIAGVSFRYQNVYGPGQSLTNPYTGILSVFSNRIRLGQPINIFEDGLESRDFVYIDDVVNATIAGIEKESANNMEFNVGTGKQISVIEVAKALIAGFKINVPFEISGMYRLGDIRHNYADVERLNKILGASAQTGFDEGINKFVDWVKSQPIIDNNYEQSIEEMFQKGMLKKGN